MVISMMTHVSLDFGVEVFVSEETRRDRLGLVSMFDNGVMYKHVWKIPNFSKLDGPCHSSEPFPAGDQLKYIARGTILHLKLYIHICLLSTS